MYIEMGERNKIKHDNVKINNHANANGLVPQFFCLFRNHQKTE